MTKYATLTVAALVGALVLAVLPERGAAHHSFAMYDRGKTETLTGRLTRFVPGANHAQLIFELVDVDGVPVIGENGKPLTWGVETGPAAMIARQGVTVDAFPLGTIITVSLNPLRDGRPFGVLASGGIVKCGTELPDGGCTAKTGELFMPGNN
jgi:hypothetical protein